MIKIAICEDEPVILEQISNLTTQVLNKASLPYTADLFLSGEELVQKLEDDCVYDIALLDIQMNQISGVDIGAILRGRFQNTKTLLIYISAFDARAKEVFYFNAIRFLSKPLEPKLFKEALLYAYKIIKEREGATYTFKEVNGGEITLPLADIYYFEITDSHRINVITSQNKYVFYEKMADVDSELSDMGFLRIHQAYLINYDHIRKISYKEVVMKNNDLPFTISGARRTEIRKQYLELRQRRELNWL